MPTEPKGVNDGLWALLGSELKERAVERAVAKGITAPDGTMPNDDLASLQDDFLREEFARPNAPEAARAPPEVIRAMADPATSRVGPFVLVSLLGKGATGEVWKAWDTHLGRWVSVKLATAAVKASVARERFGREGQSVARLDHPGIVPIYDTGIHQGRPFLVMRFIDGVTIDALDPPPTMTQLLTLLRQIALSVEHAHQHGIVHRDLKPANIMVDREGHAILLDFGLAGFRNTQMDLLTLPGEVIGTIPYMAPEQARGVKGAQGTMIDVYGLGATAYRLLTGRPPYSGDTSAETLAMVLQGRLTPLRRIRPQIPLAVELVILKAMATDPAQRYPSAQSFADDLGRLIDGQNPDAASPFRWPPFMRRFRPAFVAAIVVVSVLAWVGIKKWSRDREQAVASLRESAQLALVTALRLRRAGDLKGVRQLLPRLEQSYRGAEAATSIGPQIEFLMARVYRAVMDEKNALTHVQKALARDPDFAPALYERVVLLSRTYGASLTDAIYDAKAERNVGSPTGAIKNEDFESPSLAQLRKDILRDTRHLAALGGNDVETLAAKGIMAYHERRTEDAIRLLEPLLSKAFDREEIWETLALAFRALNRHADAEATYSRALIQDPNYAPFRDGRCHIRLRQDKFDLAEADATASLALDDRPPAAWVCRGMSRMDRWKTKWFGGTQDPSELTGIVTDLEQALARPGSFFIGFVTLAGANGSVAREEDRAGRDPLHRFAAAENAATRCIAQWPGIVDCHIARALVRLERARFLARIHKPALPEMAGALSDLNEALRVEPRNSSASRWRGMARSCQAEIVLSQGDTAAAEELFKEAAGDFERARAANDGSFWTYVLRGRMEVAWARTKQRPGSDPSALWDLAVADLSTALDINPGFAEVWARRASLRIERAAWLGRNRRGFAEQLAGAAKDLAQIEIRKLRSAVGTLAQGDLAWARGQTQQARLLFEQAGQEDRSLKETVKSRISMLENKATFDRADLRISL